MRLAALVVVLAVAPAAAENQADTLFKKGKKLLAEKRYLEACNTFESVDKLDPGIGAKLNVAKCYEEWGKLSKAYDWYADALKMANDTKDKRADKIKELVDTLDADIPRLTIKVPEGVDPVAAKITFDGKPFTELGKELRVDPGPHVIEFFANGETKTKNAPLERGGSREVTLEIPRTVARPVGPTSTSGSPGRTRKIIGIGLGSAGLVAMGVAGYLTLDARSTYNDALDAHCMGASDTCNDEGLRITADARSRANKATIITLVGVAAVAGGVVLYLTAPKSAESATRTSLYLAPSVDSDGAAVILGGGF
jgi:tetratricopeptide (TPR) repeat protein